MEFLILKKGGGFKVHPLWLPNVPNLRWPCWSFRKTLSLCHLCIEEANHCDEMTAQQASHLRSGLVVRRGCAWGGMGAGLTCHGQAKEQCRASQQWSSGLFSKPDGKPAT